MADLRRYYGVRLARRSLSSGEITLPELSAYVEHLPPDSAIARATSGLPYGWGPTEVLLAEIVQVLSGEPHPALKAADNARRAASIRARLRAQNARLSRGAPRV